MPVSERTLTEFLQHSGQVLHALTEGEIILLRRDGEDLVLMTRGQSDALTATLRAFLGYSAGGVPAVELVFPWFTFLSHADQTGCLTELREVAVAAIASGELQTLVDALYAWEATGLAAWDERELGQSAGSSLEEPLEIPRPDA